MIPAAVLVLAMTASPSRPVIQVQKHTIYSNIQMKGTEFIRSAGVGLGDKGLEKLGEAAHDMEKPHVYLVRGADMKAVITAHHAAITADAKAEGVVSAKRTDDAKADVWVAAYLGNGPGTAVMKVRGVEVDGDVIRVLTAKESPSVLTADSKPYLVWANLGQLPAGSYTLQLISGETLTKAKAVATRTVTVGRKK